MGTVYQKIHRLVNRALENSDLEFAETRLINRLVAAFILRGTPILVTCEIQVTYELVLAWTTFTVLSKAGTRPWGNPADIQELAMRLQFYYPLGILVIHHELKVAFHFLASRSPFIMDLPRALRYASIYQNCLTLARFMIDKEKCVFAYVTVEDLRQNPCFVESRCPWDLLIANACNFPNTFNIPSSRSIESTSCGSEQGIDDQM